ncbi:MAG: ribonuclease J [Alphaproteobacteria bacterium]|nr:ribonuclease J [Alphaproteobacteria bacterium]TAD87746.1 MAG: ribonuclease J [Alphaproteobacteria bacterium]
MNLNLYGYAGKWLMVDLGVTFGDDRVPGIDVVMPDPGFIVERRRDLVGLVLTHAHEDHLGAVPHLWSRLRCRVYATPFTATVLQRKLREVGLEQEVPLTILPMSSRASIGPFEIELVTLTHSIPEPNAVAIRTPVGTVVHTGDWKLDPTPLIGPTADEQRLAEIGRDGVLAVIGDSTNVFKEGESGSEADVRASLADLMAGLENRVAVACFASNIARLETIATVAAAHDRSTALVGRSLRNMVDAARANGYLTNCPPFLSEEDAGYLPRDKVCLICTGSQGEPRAALARIAFDNHPHIVLEEGDSVIFSSRIIPGNEKAIGRLHDQLARQGIEVLTERDHFVHVSGHPARDELARLYAHLKPRIVVPVHGEHRHLVEHARFALGCQVPHAPVVENGQVLRLGPGDPVVIDRVTSGRLAVDGNRLIPMDGPQMKARQRVANQGVAVCTLVLDRKGRVVADPAVSLPGLVDTESTAEAEVLSHAVRAALEALPSDARRQDDAAVAEAGRVAFRRAVKSVLGLKPHLEVLVVRV